MSANSFQQVRRICIEVDELVYPAVQKTQSADAVSNIKVQQKFIFSFFIAIIGTFPVGSL